MAGRGRSLIGTSQSALAAWENGTSIPNVEAPRRRAALREHQVAERLGGLIPGLFAQARGCLTGLPHGALPTARPNGPQSESGTTLANVPPPARAPESNLPAALVALQNAAHSLVGPRGDTAGRIPSRYTQLRGALYGARGGHGGRHTAPSSVLPLWIDAMLLLITIDDRVGLLEHDHRPPPLQHPGHPTLRRIQQIVLLHWRPQDASTVTMIAHDFARFAKAIDDLFDIKPIFLPDPCPHCGQNHTYRLADDGQRVRTPALQVSVTGAVCLACHDRWAPDELMFLGRILGYRRPAGVIG